MDRSNDPTLVGKWARLRTSGVARRVGKILEENGKCARLAWLVVNEKTYLHFNNQCSVPISDLEFLTPTEEEKILFLELWIEQ